MKLNQFYDYGGHKIYEHHGRTIATNGNILISVPSNGTGNKPSLLVGQRLTSLLNHIKRQTFIELPEIRLPRVVTCSICWGKKRATIQICDHCHGDGEVLINGQGYADRVDCQNCHGEGETITIGGDNDCPSCLGVGTILPAPPYIDVLGLYIHPSHLNIISTEPNIKISIDIKNHQLYFRAAEQMGIILGAPA